MLVRTRVRARASFTSPLCTRLLAAGLLFASVCLGPSVVHADDNAEAAALFASGNQHLQRATRLRGARRTRELESALTDYASSLRIVRSRNVIFNTSVALEMLERWDESFTYMVEYLAVPGLTDDERREGTERIATLRPRVAVLQVQSDPPGAEVWVDRRDLASHGRAPTELAVSPGSHRLWLALPGYQTTEATGSATLGSTTTVSVTLAAAGVGLQVLAPSDLPLTLDGEAIAAGASMSVVPGAHVLSVTVPGAAAPIERRFEVVAGAAPMVIDLGPAIAAVQRQSGATLAVRADQRAVVLVDGVVQGHGAELELAVSPGEHEIRLEADGYSAFTGRHQFTLGTPTSLQVSMNPLPAGGSLDPLRVVFAVLAIGGLGASAGMTVWAFQLDASQPSTAGGQSEQRDVNLGGDITWGVTAALGVTAFILLFVDDRGEGDPSQGEFSLQSAGIAPTTDGFMASATLRVGGWL